MAKNYNVFLIGIVGTAALLALLLIVLTHEPETRVGQATMLADESHHYLTPGVPLHVEGGAITLQAAAKQLVEVTVHDAETKTPITLRLGETVVQDGLALTLYRGGNDPIVAIKSEEDACGTRAEQTSYCRGTAACCGGTCTGLPDCTGREDGPVSACNTRQLYCCGEQLTFEGCGR